MARIEDQYELKVNSGGLDRFIEKAERGNRLTQALGGAMGRLARISGAMAGSLRGIVREQMEMDRSARNVSQATRALVEQLEPLETAFRSALTDGERDRALDTLTRKMERLGLVWTTEFGDMNRADLLGARSLQELALSGDITASSLAETAQAGEKADGVFKRLANGAGNLARRMLGLDRARAPLEGITNKLLRMGATLFTARKLMQYIRNAIERAPEERAAPFVGLKSDISDAGARAVVALMNGMADGVDRLRKSMASTGGQKFFRAMERSAAAAGRVVGRALDLIGSGIEWVGDNAEAVFPALAIAVGLFSVRMLGAAAATAAANAPMLLTIGLVTMLIAGLNQAGVTAGDIFGAIAELAGGLYAFGHNLVADGYNLIASFAEFFLNVWNDPVNAVGNLFFDLFDWVLSLLETVGGAVDAIAAKFHHKWNVAGEIAGLRQVLREEQAEKFSPNKITLDRMEHIDIGAVMEEWERLGQGFGDSLSGFNLAEALAEPLRDIGSDVSDIRRSVSLTAEDLKSLVDVAERRYVNHISLTSQTPVITVNGANTGRTAEDRQALADAIAEVLIEQTASGATVDTRTPA